ncbi:MAG TPA: hypothetical protein VGO89_16330 [Streptomyces sp.]|jgi:hypothetical protein|nr:hypothetical protein [Streptomyces sp.]
MLRTSIIVGTALTVLCALAVTPVHAAVPLTTKGTGFKLTTQLGVTSISPARQYTVTFASADLKKRYAPNLTIAVAQLKAAGVKISVGGVETVVAAKCPPKGHIQYTQQYRPLGKGGYSQGMPCSYPPNGVAVGGIVAMDSEYFDGSWYISPYKLHNTFVHEMLHTLGLDHPNLDLNRNGVVETYECVATSYGNKPVMCSPNGGYKTSNAGRLTAYDIAGIRALLTNAKKQGVK